MGAELNEDYASSNGTVQTLKKPAIIEVISFGMVDRIEQEYFH
jgi:hypothetical protein